MKIVKRMVFDLSGWPIGRNWGLEVSLSDKAEDVFYPVYPYSTNREALEEFIAAYRAELESCFESGECLYFCRHAFHFDTELKEKIKERWYQKGVIIN
ncbi:hypothetical protein [Streptococcus ruminantium]|uniref:Uncharacterized protein n=1 Tax=Streptococcus ruminantium TaxID=1917441 RepID=A0ABU1B6H4_9STRE|nr:hypothetical protein [Streptococcus ruminantium]MDQ8759080.1 hypothetical protein [Streptococcus ruminantium]MDQ8769636.1 hypothetical protein [Streptococcus ruminantium]MDQ8775543.1 hypothetical protein [Streptococcus ruminantium]MDQ8794441.1 hypothetical protein [Streptococcus ruminantium]MDQ8796676.1 hypothetical protein [Streptococcus ruminantium]